MIFHGAYTIKGGFSTSHGGAYIKRGTLYFPWSICLQKKHFLCPTERTSKVAFSISHGAYTIKRSIFHVPMEHILSKEAFAIYHGEYTIKRRIFNILWCVVTLRTSKEAFAILINRIPSRAKPQYIYLKTTLLYISYRLKKSPPPFNADCIARIWNSCPSKNVLYI